MTTITLRRGEHGELRPVGELDAKRLRLVGPGDEILVEYNRERNAGLHKKGMKLIDVLYQNQDHFTEKKHFYDWLKIQIGWCETFITPEGDTQYHLKSLAFDRCNDEEFSELYQAIITVGVEKLGINAALDFA